MAIQTNEQIKHDIMVRKEIAKLANYNSTLQQFLDKARTLDTEVASVLEGIYCGEEGRVKELLPARNRYLCFGWYRGRVEFAYIS